MACTEHPGFFSRFTHFTSRLVWVLSWTEGSHPEPESTWGWLEEIPLAAPTDITQVSPRLWGMWSCPVKQLRNGVHQRSFLLCSPLGRDSFFMLLVPGWEQQALLLLLQSASHKEITAVLVVTCSCNSSLLLSTSLLLWLCLKTSLPRRCHFSTLLHYQQSERRELDRQLWNVGLCTCHEKLVGWMWWVGPGQQLSTPTAARSLSLRWDRGENRKSKRAKLLG